MTLEKAIELITQYLGALSDEELLTLLCQLQEELAYRNAKTAARA